MSIRSLSGLAAAAVFYLAGVANADDWYPSKYGEGDEIGAANLLTQDMVVEAAKLVKTGKVYPLGIETNSSTPAYPPRGWKIYGPAGPGGRRYPGPHQDQLH